MYRAYSSRAALWVFSNSQTLAVADLSCDIKLEEVQRDCSMRSRGPGHYIAPLSYVIASGSGMPPAIAALTISENMLAMFLRSVQLIMP
jgi:hypothetical protein